MINLNFGQLLTFETLTSSIRFGALVVIGLPLIYAASRWIQRYASRKFTPQQGMIFGKLVLYGGVTIIALSILNELGFKLSHLLGAAGIIGIAVGFASQTSVSNVISGLFLIAEKPFEVNDIITVGGITGQVLSIDMLSIKIRTFDNKYVRIPNETIIKSDVTNITHFPIRRVDINIGVAYKEDLGRVRNVLLDIARINPLCLNEPEPMVLFTGYGNSSIDMLFAVWVAKADWFVVKNQLMEDVKKRFDQLGIEIPFPHLSLYKGSVTEPIPVNIVKRVHIDENN
ncbi:mechanosensitive ion channel family protein [candidate division KSB1 bacterium]|nr:mechanosensitive ion channel family protein [candidate division KSB1 bacterium]